MTDERIHRPVSFIFDHKVKVLEASITETTPGGIEAELQAMGSKAVLNFKLLSPGDSLLLMIICAGEAQIRVIGAN